MSNAAWRGMRLPTQLEWEAAVRAPDGRRFPWGDTWSPERCHGPDAGVDGTVPVDAHPEGASPGGCLALIGNVWEWTELDARGKPPELGDHAWVYGGSYRHPCESDGRPVRTSVAKANAYPYLGFRCVRDV